MPTDAVAVVLRPRNDWEAADLGLELARAWIGPGARVWLAAYLAPALVAVACSPWPLATAILAWWLRPCAERALLEVLARRTFGRDQTVGAALATMFRLLRTPGPLVASLAWRRLSPIRPLWLAVWHLKGLRGGAARARIGVLAREGRGVALWCACIGGIATALMALALLVGVVALLPDATGTNLQAWVEGEAPLPLRDARLWAALAIVADALCAPWVVSAVFGLYISRRTDLEAWDLEHVFRAMSRRLAMLAVVAATAWLVSVPIAAQAPARTPVPFDPEQTIREILAQPEFGRPETIQQWRFREGPRRAATPPPAWLTWVLQQVPGIAAALRWAMWLVGAMLVGWLALTVWRGRAGRRTATADGGPAMEIESPRVGTQVPRDVAARARAAIGAGAVVQALGLLYAGTLQACVERGAIELHPGDTEADCLRRLRGRLPGDAEHTLRDVVRAWQAAAYARRLPTTDQALAMCDAYVRHFEATA